MIGLNNLSSPSGPAVRDDQIAVKLLVAARAGGEKLARHREPVTLGIPFPCGMCSDPGRLTLRAVSERNVALQARVLDRWSDGSIRWVLLDLQAACIGGVQAEYELLVGAAACPVIPVPRISVVENEDAVSVDTGAARFHLRAGASFPFAEVLVEGRRALDPARTALLVEDGEGTRWKPHISRLLVERSGALRTTILLEGTIQRKRREPLLHLIVRLDFFAGSATVRVAVTLRNPQRAAHPGGYWTLGDKGSVCLRDIALTFALPSGPVPAQIRCSPEPDIPFELSESPVEIYQDSSGGENWQSPNHRNSNGVVPNTFRGYRLRAGAGVREGLRATPIVSLKRDSRELSLAVPRFWQNFPKAIEATNDTLTLRLFPRQYADVHEIQGGEQKTHQFFIAFGPDAVTDEPLAWCRAPLLAHAEPSWYAATGAIPYLVPAADDPHQDYVRLVNTAIEGHDTFEHKRERIDEYGWRHFGDIYGDHEGVFYDGPPPVVSHYNNQYDAIAGFAYQFLRTADSRWWTMMDELASHVVDIDIYHTDRDKSAYNGGLFWHTYHYVDAGTATHRSYPRDPKVGGGGPSAEHNYTTGLMLHHFLTGNLQSREAALGLAQFVIDMDDGRKTIFRWLDRGYTGLASASGSPFYHGPGRGSGNSLNALVDGHRLTGDPKILAKAEQLIRRSIHPSDDIAARNLLDAERRWFYTMFLQSLGKYLDSKAERGDLDRMYAYARASLLHYARWMTQHERPYLERPETLEYTTETWAAQDMRKSEVFQYAATHATGTERERLVERAELFFRYSTSTLAGLKTSTFARPVVIMLSNGSLHPYLQRHPETVAAAPTGQPNFGAPEIFIPQKVRVKQRLSYLLLGLIGVSVLVSVWSLLL